MDRADDRATELRAGELPVPKLDVERFRLRCGAVLLVNRRPEAPVTALRIHLRGGHSLDPPGHEGVAFLTGSLVDQGCARHTEEELAELLEPVGGSLQGDASGVMGSIAGASWKRLVELACEVVQHPTYPRAKVERQRARLLDRLLVEEQDHRAQASRLFRRLVYGDHWLGRPMWGTRASVATLQRKHLVAFHRRNWCAERAVVAVCGDVDPEQVRRLFDRLTRDWPPGRPLPPPDPSFPEPAPRSGVFKADRNQIHVFLGHLGVRRNDPRYPARVVMDHVLGTGPGFTNRISRKLRDELGLAYTVHADIHSSAGLFPGVFSAYIGTSAEHLEAAVDGFLREMRLIREEPVERDELELAKRYLIGSFVRGFERASGRVNYMVSAHRYGLPDDNLERMPHAFAAVTADDVLTVARECLRPDASCLAVGGPVTRTRVDELLRRSLRPARRRRGG